MVTKEVGIDRCPVETCDLQVTQALVTTDGTKLTTQNMVQDRTCLHPTTVTVEGEDVPGSYIVFHDSRDETVDVPECYAGSCEELASETALEDGYPLCDDHDTEEARSLYDDKQARDAQPPSPSPEPDPEELPGKADKVYERAIEATQGGETITLAAFKGRCSDLDVDPGYVSETVEMLVDKGYLAMPTDGVITQPE